MIEKDWLHFGHKFAERTNADKSGFWYEHESSPIFQQWMDTVHQIMLQFPSSFEFNELYLISILDHLYTNRFSTFLEDNDKKRRGLLSKRGIPPHSESLWDYLKERRQRFENPLYEQDPQSSPKVIYPKYKQVCFDFWKYYYLRYFLPEYDLSLKRQIVSREEPLILNSPKKASEESKEGEYFFCNIDEEEIARRAFVGTKPRVKEGWQEARFFEEYASDTPSPCIELIPMPILQESTENPKLPSIVGAPNTYYGMLLNGVGYLTSFVVGGNSERASKVQHFLDS